MVTACGGPLSTDALADEAEAYVAQRHRLMERYGGADGPLDATEPGGTLIGRPAECGYRDNELTGRFERAIRVDRTVTDESDDKLAPGAFDALWQRAGCPEADRPPVS